jgi:uncharacterized protein (DUF1697 family)
MTTYIALLRAVNVGGTGKLLMTELQALCRNVGFESVRTYIASGNVVFESAADSTRVKSQLEAALLGSTGKPVRAAIRTRSEMEAVLRDNPFPDAAPNRTLAIFLDQPPPPDALTKAVGVSDEEMRLGNREIYIHYGEGMSSSKLKVPAATIGTARNMNTVAKLVAMAK